MPAFRTNKVVNHPPEAMFDLVVDVDRYPEFLPLCEGINTKRRSNSGDNSVETFVSEMTVGYKAISEKFTTRVTADRARLHILVEYVDGPFKYLENHWSFRQSPDGCHIDFYINYEFRNFALGLLMGSVFDHAFRKFVQAFEQRADELFGKNSFQRSGISLSSTMLSQEARKPR